MANESKSLITIFTEAQEKQNPQERKAYLDGACKGDEKLRAEVEALLEAHGKAGSFLEPPPAEPCVTLDHAPRIDGPGTTIGRYVLLELIGEGGMGLVYLAEQKEPVRRKVALKIIKPGMDSRQVIARFEAERQTLAVLDHPNIAHVFDAGCTETGRPYFVMEHVKGMAVTRYCDEHKLPVEQRLRLFEQVCEGVQHAHQKGIIHRDLKPSNILVTMQGDRPVPKIIDFGIAKATTQSLTAATMFTCQGQFLGTPEYMSPEQADLAAQDIDTRSDIYSLGVVLYELLAGVLPFESDSFMKIGLVEIQRTIRETEPMSPSMRLTQMGEKAKEIAESRGTQVVPLARRLHRELEWIPLKAMRKDRCRRYRSASEMADDVRNYLNGLPLIAGPETAMYRVQKFVRKHAGSVTTVALVAVAIILGLVVSTAMYFKAERAHQTEVIARAEAEDAREKEAAARVRAEDAEKVAEEKAESYRRVSYNYGIALADAKYREGDVGGVRRLLKDSPQDLRGWEWQRLDSISDQALMTIRGHRGWGITQVVLSPDGRLIASCGTDSPIRIWDSTTGTEVKILRGHTDEVGSLAFSPDGKRIVSGSVDKTVRIWNVATQEEMMVLRGHDGAVWSVACSSDGKWIASSSGSLADSTIRLWDAQSGAEQRVLCGHERVYSICFSPDSRSIASAGRDGGIKLWDVTTGEFRVSYGTDEDATFVAFSPDGHRLISGGRDGAIRIRDSANGSALTTMRHNGQIFHAAFSPDGRRIVSCAASDNMIKTWDAQTGAELCVLRGHESSPTSASFSPDGSRIVSSSGDSTIKVWDAYVDSTLVLLPGHKSTVTALAFTPDGKQLVSGSFDGTIKTWDVASSAEIRTLHKQEREFKSVALSPDGKRIALGLADKTIKLCTLTKGEEFMTLRGHESPVYEVVFSPDGRRIVSAGNRDRTVRVWDAATGHEEMTLRGHSGRVVCVAVSPDGRYIVSGDTWGQINVWNAITGDELITLCAATNPVLQVAFSPDGQRIVSGDNNKTIKVWDLTTGEELAALKGHSGRVTSALFSRDGKRIISGSMDGMVRVWDWASGQELMAMPGSAGIYVAAFSTDGQTFATGGTDGSVVLRQCKTSPEERELRQVAERARVVVDQLHRADVSYREVIEDLNSGTSLEGSVRRVALQIADARRWEDTDKLRKESLEITSAQEADADAYKIALEKAESANRMEPNHPFTLGLLGVAQYRVGAYKNALETLGIAESIRADSGREGDPTNMAFMAMAYTRLGRIEDAKATMSRLRSLFEQRQYDGDLRARDALIEAEKLLAGGNAGLDAVWEDIKLGKVDDAAKVVTEMLSTKDPETIGYLEGVLKWLGRAYHRRGKERLDTASEYVAKIADYEMAVRFDPDRASALRDLAWLLSVCPVGEHRDAMRGIKLATKACELTSWKDYENLSTLAAAYSETGDFEAAVNWQKKAADLLPESCPPELNANYESRLSVYASHKPYHKGSLWSFSDGELVAHWTFDTLEDGKVPNSVGKDLHGRLVGDAHIVSDPERGNVLNLDGKGDYVDCRRDSPLPITGSVTCSVWMKATTPEEGVKFLLQANTWWLCSTLDKRSTEFGGDFIKGEEDVTEIWTETSIAVNDGKWHHLVGVHDGARICLYVDGILADFENRGGNTVIYNDPVYIGGEPHSKYQWNGLIDDVRIYSYALTAEEVKGLYEGKEPPRERRSE